MPSPKTAWYKKMLLLHLPATERFAGYALLVSIATMIFSMIQFNSQNEYAKQQLQLAYRPYIIAEKDYSESPPYKIMLSNKGNGTAIIRKVDLYYHNRLMTIENGRQIMKDSLNIDPNLVSIAQQIMGNSSAINSNEKFEFFKITAFPPEYQKVILDFYMQLAIIVVYSSLTNDYFMSVGGGMSLQDSVYNNYPKKLVDDLVKEHQADVTNMQSLD